jgi:hypothetical protein
MDLAPFGSVIGTVAGGDSPYDYACRRSGMGPVAQPVFKTGAAWQPHARSVRLRRRSVKPKTSSGKESWVASEAQLPPQRKVLRGLETSRDCRGPARDGRAPAPAKRGRWLTLASLSSRSHFVIALGWLPLVRRKN